MSQLTRILIVDDEKNMRNLLVDVLEDDGWQVVACESGEAALALLKSGKYQVPIMILDLAMPGVDGFQVIEETRNMGLDTSIVVITAYGTVDTAVRAMQAGATDFVVKPFNNTLIKGTVRRAMESRDLVSQVELTHPEFEGADGAVLPIIGEDQRLRSIFKVIRRISDLKTTVLITGESGTGKELVAQAMHFNGSRRDKPFVAVNCGALPENLLESEFFGHERGAFTGAHALQRGKFEISDGGTLFLDEIGEMPLNLQVKLLRVLQEGIFTRVGGEREIQVDVRVIAATNRDLAQAVASRSFREDLYYRLNVIPIHLPPLRERADDIPHLIVYFMDRFCKRHKLPPLKVNAQTMKILRAQPWPGNIRELQNVVEKAVILQDADMLRQPMRAIGMPISTQLAKTPELEPLAEHKRQEPSEDADEALVELGKNGEIRELSEVAAEAQRKALIRAIRLCGGNKAEAAKRLGVSYKTLFNRIHELGISTTTNVK